MGLYFPFWNKNFIRDNSKKKVLIDLFIRHLFQLPKVCCPFTLFFMMTLIAAIFSLSGQYFDFLGRKSSNFLINLCFHLAQKALLPSPYITSMKKEHCHTTSSLEKKKKKVGRNFWLLWFLYQICDGGSMTTLFSILQKHSTDAAGLKLSQQKACSSNCPKAWDWDLDSFN